MKKKKFKIALAQIKIEQKNIEENCKKIFEKIEEAAKENVDIICFPELATIGYTITTDELKKLPEDFNNTFIEKLQEKAKFFKIHLLVGYLESKTITNHHFKWWFALCLKGTITSLRLKPYNLVCLLRIAPFSY